MFGAEQIEKLRSSLERCWNSLSVLLCFFALSLSLSIRLSSSKKKKLEEFCLPNSRSCSRLATSKKNTNRMSRTSLTLTQSNSFFAMFSTNFDDFSTFFSSSLHFIHHKNSVFTGVAIDSYDQTEWANNNLSSNFGWRVLFLISKRFFFRKIEYFLVKPIYTLAIL